MLWRISRRASDVLKLPNHSLLYAIVLTSLGALVATGAAVRLYELREFFPFKLPDEVNEFILNYIPFIVGTFITTVAALAGFIVGLNWALSGLRELTRFRVPLRWAGDYRLPESVSLGLKEGRMQSYERSPSLFFYVLGKVWTNAQFVSEISGEQVRRNIRFIWKAAFIGLGVYYLFRMLEYAPIYLSRYGLGENYVIPSAAPFYNLLIIVCVFKLLIALSLIPMRKPQVGRELDSMIVEGKGHPAVFFAILEEGSKIFAHKAFPNRVSRSRPVLCEDGETLIGTLIESFPEYVRTTNRFSALLSLFLGSLMVLVGFLQIILTQYPTFSVGYADFFQVYFLSLLLDIGLNVMVILLGKGFLEQARLLMAVYRFKSSLVYLEAKGSFEKRLLPDLNGIVAPERLFNPLSSCAFNVRYFSAEAVSEAVTPEGIRELVALETSGRLARDVTRLKYLPFQVDFQERYPSSWVSSETDFAVDEGETCPENPVPAHEHTPVDEEAPTGVRDPEIAAPGGEEPIRAGY